MNSGTSTYEEIITVIEDSTWIIINYPKEIKNEENIIDSLNDSVFSSTSNG